MFSFLGGSSFLGGGNYDKEDSDDENAYKDTWEREDKEERERRESYTAPLSLSRSQSLPKSSPTMQTSGSPLANESVNLTLGNLSSSNYSMVHSMSSSQLNLEGKSDLLTQNLKLSEQLQTLQALVNSQNNLYLEYKNKYESSEAERIKASQQSSSIIISLQSEIEKLESKMRQFNEATQEMSCLKEAQQVREVELANKCEDLLTRAEYSESELEKAKQRIIELETQLSSATTKKTLRIVNKYSDIVLEGHESEAADLSGKLPENEIVTPSLLEYRLLENKYMQWSSAIHLRESSMMFKQCERVRLVMDQLHDNNSSNKLSQLTATSHVALKKSIDDLEKSFESSRKFAVSLDTQLESTRKKMQVDILSVLEPEFDRLDLLYSELDLSMLYRISEACSTINKSIRYKPGDSKLRQEHSDDVSMGYQGGKHSVEYLYNLRKECEALMPILNNFVEIAQIKCEGIKIAKGAHLRQLEDVMEDAYLYHGGDYSLLCDLLSCTITVDSLDVLQELLCIVGTNDADRKRVNIAGLLSTPAAAKFPRYALMALKNKFNPSYDAIQFSGGYRDLCIYLRLIDSKFPMHLAEIKVELSEYVHSVGLGGGWITRLFKEAKPLKIFDDPYRIHIGPITRETAVDIKGGLIQTVCLDNFPFALSGGDLLIASLSQSVYCALQDISLHGSSISDSDMSILVAVLSLHKRLRSIRVSGERNEVRGQLSNIQWDIFEQPYTSPASDRGFSRLQSLDYSYNTLKGNLYPFISSLFPALTSLNVDDNLLSGHIPPDLGNITTLQYLVLSRNQFTGPIPHSLGNLTFLKDLQLWQNKVSGEIPSSLCKLTNLLRLNIDSCMLEGPIPSEIGNLVALRELFLFDNRLSGEIPRSISGLQSLQFLGLNGNQLSGNIPVELFSLRKLKTLYLHENCLFGTIPSEVSNLVDLRKFSVRGNRLDGQIPREIGALLSLQVLSLSENQLSGPIPREITNLQQLESFAVANNRLTGSFPPHIGRLTALKIIDVTKNQLSGPIPADIGMLYNLAEILLGENCFEGKIPQEIGRLPDVKVIELQGSQLSGTIPVGEISRLRSLQSLDLTRNCLSDADAAEQILRDRLGNRCRVQISFGQKPSK